MTLSRMQSVLSAGILSFAVAAAGQGAFSQTPASGTADSAKAVKVPSLDVISVKPNKSAGGGSSWGATPDGVMGKNLAVHMMLVSAYGLNDNQLLNEP
ncbi:MAG TPA: hypothetical protein VII58_06475, partial [Acidobacteriaceae bacterium]